MKRAAISFLLGLASVTAVVGSGLSPQHVEVEVVVGVEAVTSIRYPPETIVDSAETSGPIVLGGPVAVIGEAKYVVTDVATMTTYLFVDGEMVQLTTFGRSDVETIGVADIEYANGIVAVYDSPLVRKDSEMEIGSSSLFSVPKLIQFDPNGTHLRTIEVPSRAIGSGYLHHDGWVVTDLRDIAGRSTEGSAYDPTRAVLSMIETSDAARLRADLYQWSDLGLFGELDPVWAHLLPGTLVAGNGTVEVIGNRFVNTWIARDVGEFWRLSVDMRESASHLREVDTTADVADQRFAILTNDMDVDANGLLFVARNGEFGDTRPEYEGVGHGRIDVFSTDDGSLLDTLLVNREAMFIDANGDSLIYSDGIDHCALIDYSGLRAEWESRR